MSKLEFKCADFCTGTNASCDCCNGFCDAINTSYRANARLQQMLEECPRVYCFKGMRSGQSWTEERFDKDTHTAILVNIEEIGK